jgi:hypothetical protein
VHHWYQLVSELADGSSCPDQAVVQWCFQHTAKAEWTFTTPARTASALGNPVELDPKAQTQAFRFPWYRATSLFAHQIISLCAVWGAAVQSSPPALL